ncbi:uncharacterized protein LOC135378800 [Ornithodoros turicata]|uniref:uncharacterized protein LOC135378800 n=1 Tax=Ornithodoros turicata TaxID=34597 RepID=UPI003138EE75
MTRVPFGARSSPFLLSATIQHDLRFAEKDYPQTAALLASSFYVDDLVVSVDAPSDAVTLYEQTLSIFESAGMKVKKRLTNDNNLLQRMIKDGNTTVDSGQNLTKKVLGLLWDHQADEFRCSPVSASEMPSHKNNKRHVLQSASKIYDPFGQLGSFTITGKILVQSVWEAGFDWEDPLPTDIESTWKEWCNGLSELSHVSIPRLIRSNNDKLPKWLYIFADASPKAYGAVAYVDVPARDACSSPRFLLSKSRVAPLKRHALPRLELMAAVLAARLSRFICESPARTARLPVLD